MTALSSKTEANKAPKRSWDEDEDAFDEDADGLFDDLDEASATRHKVPRLGNEARISEIAKSVLKAKFGHAEFRHEQQGAITRVLGGDNTLVVFPTGAGKSLCYQVSSVSPLTTRGQTVKIHTI